MDVLQSTQKNMGVLGFHFISMLEKVVAFVATCTDS